MNTWPSELRKIVQRLEKSDSRQKRKNARAAMQQFLQRLKREYQKEFPLLDVKGDAIIPPKRPVCPVCGTPVRNWTALAEHIIRKHRQGRIPAFATKDFAVCSCWCGREFRAMSSSRTQKAITAFGRHLSGVQNLKQHITLGALANQGEAHADET